MDPTTDEQAMAQMMGFTSFGTQDQHPQKKRRYNPKADAATDSPLASSTGSNSTPLGVRPTSTAAATATVNTDEINLDDDDYDNNEVEPQQALPTISSLPTVPSLPQRPAFPIGRGGGGGYNTGHGGRGHNRNMATRHHHTAQQEGQEGEGERTPWYEDYYDSLSNENPWRRLEKALGMQSSADWEREEASV